MATMNPLSGNRDGNSPARERLSKAAVDAHALALRRSVVAMIQKVRVGYLLQGLGAADIFATLFFSEMRYRPDEPAWRERDRFILSTAHNTAVFYATLAHAGYFPVDRLTDYTDDGSPLEVNASERVGPMVEATCGSLGQGLSVAVGMALALRHRGSGARVYIVLGDGELQEGQIWEAALSAGSYGLDNLCVIVDRNHLQVEGHTDDVLRLNSIPDKFAAFDWGVAEVNGNDSGALLTALAQARACRGKPFLINALTVPGAGVPFLEGQMSHVALLTPDEADRANACLERIAP